MNTTIPSIMKATMTRHFQSIYWLFFLRRCLTKFLRFLWHSAWWMVTLIKLPLSGRKDGTKNLQILSKLYQDLQAPFPKRQILYQLKPGNVSEIPGRHRSPRVLPVCRSMLRVSSRGWLIYEPASHGTIKLRLDVNTSAPWEVMKRSLPKPSESAPVWEQNPLCPLCP